MGGLQAKSMTSQRYRAVTRWRICVTMATLWQQQDGGYALLFYIFNSTVIDWTFWEFFNSCFNVQYFTQCFIFLEISSNLLIVLVLIAPNLIPFSFRWFLRKGTLKLLSCQRGFDNEATFCGLSVWSISCQQIHRSVIPPAATYYEASARSCPTPMYDPQNTAYYSQQ